MDLVLHALQHCELVGEAISDKDFLVGEQFLQHVTFAGCSPFIQLEPLENGGKEFCYLSLLGPFEKPELFLCSNRSRPRCPSCKHRPDNWKQLSANWQEDPTHNWPCEKCGTLLSPLILDWRHYAAWGRLLVEIHQIYPGEAIPGNKLMQQLRHQTGIEWDYGWADNP